MYKTYGDSVLMNQFNNAVIDEAVKTTDELKETAKQIRTNVETNAQNYASSYQMSSEEYITTMLNQQGYEYEQLDDFCLLAAKCRKCRMTTLIRILILYLMIITKKNNLEQFHTS